MFVTTYTRLAVACGSVHHKSPNPNPDPNPNPLTLTVIVYGSVHLKATKAANRRVAFSAGTQQIELISADLKYNST